jgi:predicted lysophospholipase L1 biosynthesis ABC-type transport system permease subunit
MSRSDRWNSGFGSRSAPNRTTCGASYSDRPCAPVVLGVVVGIVVTYWAAQFLQALLVHVDARDLSTYAFVTAVLLVVGVLAAWLPARRAVRTDPAVVLRAQ